MNEKTLMNFFGAHAPELPDDPDNPQGPYPENSNASPASALALALFFISLSAYELISL